MKSILRTITAVVCILIVAISAFLILQKIVRRTGVDLTERKIYTLSDGTKKIVSELNEPLTLKLYYSRALANKGPENFRRLNTYFLYVRDMLQQYAALSHGKIKLEVIDPRTWSDEEEAALRSGIPYRQIRFAPEDDDHFFFGLAAETERGQALSISFLAGDEGQFIESDTEYNVSLLISRIEEHARKRIGILSPALPVMGASGPDRADRKPPWLITQALAEEGDLVSVRSDATTIDPKLDLLVVIYPVGLPPETLYAIDQYVMKGGRLVAFVDPYCPTPTDNKMIAISGFLQLDFNKLLRGWGVEMKQGELAVDRVLGVKEKGQEVVGLVRLNEKCMNPDEIVTANLHDVAMYFPGRLEAVPDAGTQMIPLMTTLPAKYSDVPAGAVWKPEPNDLLVNSQQQTNVRGPNPENVLKAVRDLPDTESTLACRIVGKLKTNYPDGPPESTSGFLRMPAQQTPTVKETAGETSVIVFADVDMLWDAFGPQLQANVIPMLNSIDFLLGKPELIPVRSRGGFNRPFTRLDQIEAKAQEDIKPRQEQLEKSLDQLLKEIRQLQQHPQLSADDIKAIRDKEQKLRSTQKEIRQLLRDKVRTSEDLEATLQFHNLFWAPMSVLVIAAGLFVHKQLRRLPRRRGKGQE